MKKLTLMAMVTLLVLSFSALAFAAPAQSPVQGAGNWCPYYGQYYNNLTDDQKAQVDTWNQQMSNGTYGHGSMGMMGNGMMSNGMMGCW